MLPSGLPEHIDDGEELARFLTQSSHYNRNRAVVKPAAFLPSPTSQETSVSRHGREPKAELWTLGRQAAGERNLHGAAFLAARSVRAAGLEADSAEPPDRHAALRGWPRIASDPAMQKARQKELAVQLASAAGEPLLLGRDDAE